MALEILCTEELLKYLTRNQYAFFVVEKIMELSNNQEAKLVIAKQVETEIPNVNDFNLKSKWEKLVRRIRGRSI